MLSNGMWHFLETLFVLHIFFFNVCKFLISNNYLLAAVIVAVSDNFGLSLASFTVFSNWYAFRFHSCVVPVTFILKEDNLTLQICPEPCSTGFLCICSHLSVWFLPSMFKVSAIYMPQVGVSRHGCKNHIQKPTFPSFFKIIW